jgi:hypothetical protein
MKAYKEEVIKEAFPAQEHSFTMPDKTLEELKKMPGMNGMGQTRG